jgi:hypothetical protein
MDPHIIVDLFRDVIDEDGKVMVAGTFAAEQPVGGATEAKQDTQITAAGTTNTKLAGGLPAALTALGNLKVSIEEGSSSSSGGLTDTELRATPVPVSLSAGTNNIGDVDVLSLPALAAGSATIGNVGLVAGEAHVGSVGVTCVEVSATFARPNDTTAYTAKDAVSNSTSAPTILTFSNVARNNAGCGYIYKARLFIDSATAMLGAAFRLHLYHTAPTAVNDNAAFPLLYANKDKRLGYIDFPATTTEGTGSDCSSSMWIDMPIAFTCAAADNDIYGALEITTTGAAPTANHNIWVALTIQQN